MARKFFIKINEHSVGNELTITGEEFNHIKNVMRYNINDSLEIIDGKGNTLLCTISSINKNDLILKILKTAKCVADPKTNVTLFQALVKGEKLELITQKITELGITKLVPFSSEFCQVKPNTTRIDRLEKISIEALKQCGRSKLLEISNILSFDEMVKSLSEYEEVIFAYENAENAFDINCLENKKNIAIVVGSEGGFSKSEANLLTLCKNVKTISLGKRILRAETASIALSTIVLFSVGELS